MKKGEGVRKKSDVDATSALNLNNSTYMMKLSKLYGEKTKNSPHLL